MTTKKKLIDVSGDVITNGGIFTALNNLNVPWKNDVTASSLDLEYYFNISGQKTISPLLRKILGTGETLTPANLVSLSNVIYNMFGRNWEEIYATMNYEYDPLVNYDMTESESATIDTTDETSHTGTVGNSSTESATGSGSGSTESGLYGFNSATAVNDSESETTTSNTNSVTGSNTRTDNLTDESTGNREESRTLTRSGNIGVMTAQSLISEQRSLWLWNFFYTVVFPDVNKVLTVATYCND